MPATHISGETGRTDLTITREFEALREHAFRAFVDPVLYVRRQGPRRPTTRRECFEPRTGGGYGSVQTDMAGGLNDFHGVYHGVSVPGTTPSGALEHGGRV